MKTGYTSSAGYCLVATAEKNSMRLIAWSQEQNQVKIEIILPMPC
ncbi:MAG: hypothetical protein Ct9H300mP6_01070 [Gammaproteobacteria bacterium]|nr:MAG: hypothetical protein Ct9H300mP6_01070 [Gammaproteobacteria bacterium]